MAAQTFSAVSGMARCRMPQGSSASMTALRIAGVPPIVPLSPTPLTPSGLSGGGVATRPVVTNGTCVAAGTAESSSDVHSARRWYCCPPRAWTGP